MAEISPIKYSSELQKLVFPDNSFYKKSVTETGVADTVTAVERPVQGSKRKAKKGEPTSLPLVINTSKDSKDSYPIDLVYAEPVAVDLPGEYALNYNKRQVKQQQQAAEIETKCADIAVYNWGPTLATNIIQSSGTARASNVVGLTGNRKAITKDDILNVHNLLMRMNISGAVGKWFGLLTPDCYSDLLKIADFVDYEKTGVSSKLELGIIGRLAGIEFMVRSVDEAHTGLIYTSAKVKKDLDSVALTTSDLPANLFWNDKMVAHAEGIVKTSINANAPGYLGATIIESWLRFGAATRLDQRGVVSLVEYTG
jgi:hypothetical protein